LAPSNTGVAIGTPREVAASSISSLVVGREVSFGFASSP
jgi:hypothetical protein